MKCPFKHLIASINIASVGFWWIHIQSTFRNGFIQAIKVIWQHAKSQICRYCANWHVWDFFMVLYCISLPPASLYPLSWHVKEARVVYFVVSSSYHISIKNALLKCALPCLNLLLFFPIILCICTVFNVIGNIPSMWNRKRIFIFLCITPWLWLWY